jgi:hypothetical protein
MAILWEEKIKKCQFSDFENPWKRLCKTLRLRANNIDNGRKRQPIRTTENPTCHSSVQRLDKKLMIGNRLQIFIKASFLTEKL